MFSFPIVARCFVGLAVAAGAACVGSLPAGGGSGRGGIAPGGLAPGGRSAGRLDSVAPAADRQATVFYTVTGEIALARHDLRVAALQYAALAQSSRDPSVLQRATEVTAECLQPSLTAAVAVRWMAADPEALEAHRAAARAALELDRIDQSAAEYRVVLASSVQGIDAEFAALEKELAGSDNVYGARQVADRLAGEFAARPAALRLRAFVTLRADDPAAAVMAFQAALSAISDESQRRELNQGLWRAQILGGAKESPLAAAEAAVDRDDTAENRIEYALLLMAAREDSAAEAQLTRLLPLPEARAAALRLLALLEFQRGDLDQASAHFAELAGTAQFMDEALYHLGLIAERHRDFQRALRLFAQVQSGDDAVAALVRAAVILRNHGAAAASNEVFDRLVEEEPQRAPEILVARAHLDADAGDAPAALSVLEHAEQQYPDNLALRYAFASIADEAGQVGAALAVLKGIVAMRPADPTAINAYGYTLADHSRHLAEARRLIEQAHRSAPRNAAILDSMGWVLYRQGHLEQALPYLNDAYADEHDAEIAAHLGELLWRLDRRVEAERIWDEAARTDADNHLLKATQRRLHAAP